ncbi:MAG: BREX-1 system phosphatase PglZ type A, partial [SAR324 cluster bacterium]|nr:BREX-1 system phosphatase PglZ type A [SAR324 cluster bacterium]
MDRIQQALTKIFERHRIVFWYDTKKELRQDFESLDFTDIEKIELNNNAFMVKHRILREQPDQKFLLYHEGEQPQDLENWLLDVQLAQGEFRTDQVSIWLSELGLGLEFADVIQSHIEFFNSGKRREALKKLLKPDDTPGMIRMKILSVCASSGPRIDEVLESLLEELADGRPAEQKDEKIRLIERSSLSDFLWDQLKRHYSYDSGTTGVKDFVIELFKSCYAMGTDGNVRLNSDALVFLRRWKDSRQYERAFETLSHQCAEILGIEQDLQSRDFKQLVELDYFQLIDKKILSSLIKSVSDRTISTGDVALLARQRRQSHWYNDFRGLYNAVEYASLFLSTLDEISISINSMAEGIQSYSRVWYKIDQLYRKFLFHVRKSGQISLMNPLIELVENLYTNKYLLKINDNWQQVVDSITQWEASPVESQRRFFKKWVDPFLSNNKKVFVIISDALRFEIGEELLGLIRKEDRYEAKIDPALSMLPSYTQLGMAALLPNKELSVAEDDSATAFVDGHSSMGTANRNKILSQSVSQAATAIQAKDLLQLNKDDCRQLIKEHDVVYVYHNRIDKTGDTRDSEERVFEAAEETLQDVIKLIKKLTAANANNLLVTSDHGFVYQDKPIDDSDFVDAEPVGSQILFRDRRFILGKGLVDQAGLRKFTSKEVNLAGDIEIQIPKSINRLRLKGSGSRYVHGGASLQEV